jgi:phage shock protein PspC (stress-responsive transcriptional regulator)
MRAIDRYIGTVASWLARDDSQGVIAGIAFYAGITTAILMIVLTLVFGFVFLLW